MNHFQPSALTLERLLSSSRRLGTLWVKSPSVYPPGPWMASPGAFCDLTASFNPHQLPNPPVTPPGEEDTFLSLLVGKSGKKKKISPRREGRLERLSSLPPAQPTSQSTLQPQPQAVSKTFHDAESPGLSTCSSFSLKCLPP